MRSSLFSKRLTPMLWAVGLLVVALATCAPAVPPATPSPTAVPTTPTPPSQATTMPTPVPTPEPAPTGLADVLFVQVVRADDGSWTFHVTIRSPDTGWENYADGWDVVTPEGDVLKRDPADPFTRLLLHPHVDEQPFTRSQRGIVIPEGVTRVTVRAHQKPSGFGGREVVVDLTRASGPDFEVQGALSPQTRMLPPAAYTFPRPDGNHLAAGRADGALRVWQP